MQKVHRKKQISFFLCFVLAVTMALSAAGCNGRPEQDSSSSASGQQTETQSESQLEENQPENDSSDSLPADNQAGDNVLGEGEAQFDFTVVDQAGDESKFEIHTDKKVVGEALQELGLIEGEEGEYGIFVKTVNGITADYDKDGVYWAFYVNDEYAQSGVDSTEIVDGDSYAFKVE